MRQIRTIHTKCQTIIANIARIQQLAVCVRELVVCQWKWVGYKRNAYFKSVLMKLVRRRERQKVDYFSMQFRLYDRSSRLFELLLMKAGYWPLWQDKLLGAIQWNMSPNPPTLADSSLAGK